MTSVNLDTLRDTQNFIVSVTTRFTIRQDLNRADKLAPIYLFISGSDQRERLNLKIYVSPKNWDKKKQTVKPVDKMHYDLNLLLEHVKGKINDIMVTFRVTDRILTPRLLKEELADSDTRVNFTAYMTSKIKEDKSLKKSTARRYLSVANNLELYRKDVPFTEITESFINKYRNYMLGKGNKSSTVNGNIKLIKQYLNRARKKDGIKLQVDTDDIVGGSTNGNRTALTPAEIRTLCRYYFDKKVSGTEQLTLGYFLFACMTGLRVSQLQDLKRHELLSDEISFINFKNNKDQVIQLNKMARKIVDFHPDLFLKHHHANTMNADLKRLMKNNRIKKHVTFHVARHSFSTNFLRTGGKVEHLQKLLSHSKIETTMTYVHILAAEANKEIHNLDNLFKNHGFDLDLE